MAREGFIPPMLDPNWSGLNQRQPVRGDARESDGGRWSRRSRHHGHGEASGAERAGGDGSNE